MLPDFNYSSTLWFLMSFNVDASNLRSCKRDELITWTDFGEVSTENCGWTLEDNQYHFNCFEGDQLPVFVSE